MEMQRDYCKPESEPVNVAYMQGIAQSVQRLATGWIVRSCISVGEEIFRNPSDRPRGPPDFAYNGYQVSFPRVKRPGRGANHLPPIAPRVKNG